jgi:hypothetical protein
MRYFFTMTRAAQRRSRLVGLAAAIALITSALLASAPDIATASPARQSAPIGCSAAAPVSSTLSPACPTRSRTAPIAHQFTVSSPPTVTGTARIGYTLTAHVAPWSPTPMSLTYQWLDSGSVIPGATTSSYALTIAVVDTEISVRIVGRYATYATKTYTSPPLVVGLGLFGSTPTPTISGAAHVNMTLTASSGNWSPTPDLLNYQWKSNGVAIAGETNSTYDVSPGQVGRRISVSVTATRFDFTPKTTTSASTAAVTVAIPIPRDGTYSVGVNLAPGTYITTSSTTDCYWERDSDFSGSLGSIIANDFQSGEIIVTIEPSDAKFYASRCGRWERLEDAPSPLKTSFGTGIYAVGQQIEAGTYQATSGTDCYWATLSGFSGELGDIIANDFAGTTVVDIPAGVVGFDTSDCGTWKRIGP